MAYQGYGHRLGPDFVKKLHRLVLGSFAPDLTLVFDLPLEVGLKRALSRASAETRFERMGLEFHKRLRQGFRAIARQNPKRCRLVDASGDETTVAKRIERLVAIRFGVKVVA
jgi:dTMP kinase